MKRIKGMGNLLRYLICIACVAVILLPIGILIHGSFQGGGIKNYVDILTKYHIETYFINSLIISVSVVVLVVVLDVLAGTFCLLAAASLICLTAKKMSRKHTIPFIPFLAAGYLLSVLTGGR